MSDGNHAFNRISVMVWASWLVDFLFYFAVIFCFLSSLVIFLLHSHLCSQCSVFLLIVLTCLTSHISLLSITLFPVCLSLHVIRSLVQFVFKPVLFPHSLSHVLNVPHVCSVPCVPASLAHASLVCSCLFLLASLLKLAFVFCLPALSVLHLCPTFIIMQKSDLQEY